MAIQFEKLTDKIQAMGSVASERGEISAVLLDELLRKMAQYATNWKYIDLCLTSVLRHGHVDKQKYRAARPLYETEPLNIGIDPPRRTPDYATLIAVDGSQALPSRHAPFLYYLINIGCFIYHHGSFQAPEEESIPSLFYMGDGETESIDAFRAGTVSIKRDMEEIGALARAVWANKFSAAPIVAILDQRLQYWPIGAQNQQTSQQYVARWLEGMETIKRCNALLAGYIERPETASVISLLYTLDLESADFNPARLNERPVLRDTQLYRRILDSGQRSCVYEVVNESTNYAPFREANQEICFFYYNPPGGGDVTRVDIPKWAAQQSEVVEQIHALLHEQCLLLGNYPYILTRADEIAVVQRSDQEYLDHLITLEMERQGIKSNITGKQFGKDLSRSGKTRHGL